LSNPELEKLEKRARNILLFQLGRSMKTREQLRQILQKREIPSEVAEPILTRFVEAQLIDDRAFAFAYVQSKIAVGGKSASALRRELRAKGVDGTFIDQALESLDAETEWRIALELARKRTQRMTGLDEQTKRRRVLGFLMRRGFSAGVSSRTLAEALASE
jgi:regulatory protein